jgi:hypothetical protein
LPESDRAQFARIFAPISRSSKSALEAIVSDHNFSHHGDFSREKTARDQIFLRDRKNFFDRA